MRRNEILIQNEIYSKANLREIIEKRSTHMQTLRYFFLDIKV